MTTFLSRRWRNSLLLLLVVAAFAALGRVYADSLATLSFATGWLLLGTCFS